MKVAFVGLPVALPLIVTIAPVVGSELITNVPGWEGICANKAGG